MTIEFFYLADSPPCRTVWMILKALDLNFDHKIVNLHRGEHNSEAHLKRNPRKRIPVIKDEDLFVSESQAIATYLCNQYEQGDDKTRLYPVDPKARAIVDQLLWVSASNTDLIQSYVNVRGVLFGNQNRDEEKITEAHKALKLGEEFLNRNGGYMAADHLTLADFFIASPVILLTELTKFNDFKDYPKTEAWFKKIKNLPYYDECNKVGMERLYKMYTGNLEKLKK